MMMKVTMKAMMKAIMKAIMKAMMKAMMILKYKLIHQRIKNIHFYLEFQVKLDMLGGIGFI